MPEPHIGLRLDQEDRDLLDACSARMKLSKSDIMRLALRAYAKSLGVAAKPKRRGRKP